MNDQERFEILWLEFRSSPKAWWVVASEEERTVLWEGFNRLYLKALFDLCNMGRVLLAIESEKLGQPLMGIGDILSVLGQVEEKYG